MCFFFSLSLRCQYIFYCYFDGFCLCHNDCLDSDFFKQLFLPSIIFSFYLLVFSLLLAFLFNHRKKKNSYNYTVISMWMPFVEAKKKHSDLIYFSIWWRFWYLWLDHTLNYGVPNTLYQAKEKKLIKIIWLKWRQIDAINSIQIQIRMVSLHVSSLIRISFFFLLFAADKSDDIDSNYAAISSFHSSIGLKTTVSHFKIHCLYSFDCCCCFFSLSLFVLQMFFMSHFRLLRCLCILSSKMQTSRHF